MVVAFTVCRAAPGPICSPVALQVFLQQSHAGIHAPDEATAFPSLSVLKIPQEVCVLNGHIKWRQARSEGDVREGEKVVELHDWWLILVRDSMP